jgi:hypothetical protein
MLEENLGDGGRRLSDVLPAVLRFALWLAAYVIVGLLIAIFVESFVNWFFPERKHAGN